MFDVSSSALVSGLINGLCLSCIYILIALGLTLIMSIMNIIQFSHGEIYMIGAFVTYYLFVKFGVNVFLAMFLSMLVAGFLGFLIEKFLIRRLLGDFDKVLCVTVGLMLILQTGALVGFGADQKIMPNILPGVWHIFEWTLPFDRLAAMLVSIGLTIVLFLFLKSSKYGQAIIATSQNKEGAVLQGINPMVMYALVMTIGSALAAVGGAFAGSLFTLNPFMGGTAIMKGIYIIVLGGMGSLFGVIVGGIIIGFADALLPLLFGPAVSVITPIILIMIILVVRRQGLFGHE